MNKTQKLIIAVIAGFLAVIIPYYLFFNQNYEKNTRMAYKLVDPTTYFKVKSAIGWTETREI